MRARLEPIARHSALPIDGIRERQARAKLRRYFASTQQVELEGEIQSCNGLTYRLESLDLGLLRPGKYRAQFSRQCASPAQYPDTWTHEFHVLGGFLPPEEDDAIGPFEPTVPTYDTESGQSIDLYLRCWWPTGAPSAVIVLTHGQVGGCALLTSPGVPGSNPQIEAIQYFDQLMSALAASGFIAVGATDASGGNILPEMFIAALDSFRDWSSAAHAENPSIPLMPTLCAFVGWSDGGQNAGQVPALLQAGQAHYNDYEPAAIVCFAPSDDLDIEPVAPTDLQYLVIGGSADDDVRAGNTLRHLDRIFQRSSTTYGRYGLWIHRANHGGYVSPDPACGGSSPHVAEQADSAAQFEVVRAATTAFLRAACVGDDGSWGLYALGKQIDPFASLETLPGFAAFPLTYSLSFPVLNFQNDENGASELAPDFSVSGLVYSASTVVGDATGRQPHFRSRAMRIAWANADLVPARIKFWRFVRPPGFPSLSLLQEIWANTSSFDRLYLQANAAVNVDTSASADGYRLRLGVLLDGGVVVWAPTNGTILPLQRYTALTSGDDQTATVLTTVAVPLADMLFGTEFNAIIGLAIDLGWEHASGELYLEYLGLRFLPGDPGT